MPGEINRMLHPGVMDALVRRHVAEWVTEPDKGTHLGTIHAAGVATEDGAALPRQEAPRRGRRS